jgi:hypothetical protein
MSEPEDVLLADLRRLADLPDDDLIAEIRRAASIVDPVPPALLDTIRAAIGCGDRPGDAA